jgi:TolB protein
MRWGRILALLLLAAAVGIAQHGPAVKRSKIAVYDLKTKSVKVIFEADQLIEAPNWSPDGKYLLVNTGGELYRLAAGGPRGQLEKIDLGGLTRCNNDKGISPKGDLIAFSSSGKAKGSQVYTVPASGGDPKQIVAETPSYFHAFSPDGKYLSFVAQRGGNFDLFRVPVDGGEQQRLTTSEGYDDGPDYSPEGQWIYFNSNRSGSWDIWRMPADGAGEKDKLAQRITSDDMEDWFPHCSPDGKWLVFLSFPKGTSGHNDRMDGVSLRMMPLPKKASRKPKIETLTTFFGGQGTINVNSWAPDSSKFAYVIYEQ